MIATVTQIRPRKRKCDELSVRRYMYVHPAVRDIVRFDTFTGKPILMRSMPRPDVTVSGVFMPRPWQDMDTTGFIEWLISERFDKVRRSTIDHVILLEAATKSFSSAAERFDGMVGWDGQRRLDDFLINACGITEGDEDRLEYLRRASRRFFISVLARVFKPGCKVDTVLVLEGPQGIKKSQLLRVLAINDEWFSDSLPHNLGSKDAKQHLLGKLIIEMSEIAHMDKTSTEAVKAFLSAQDDKFRPPYGRHEVMWKRQCIFVGTTNDDTYLKDITGNRRYWPVACGDIDLTFASNNIEQVYAEALLALRAGERWWFENGEVDQALEEQSRRKMNDPWEELALDKLLELEAAAIGRGDATFEVNPTTTLSNWFNVPVEKQESAHLSRVGKILKSLGGVQVRIRSGEGRTYYRKFWISNVGRGR